MLKIMIVDDETIIRNGLSKNIPWNEHGFRISALAEDGERALEFMHQDCPDIVITDIRMPFKDGMELAADIRDKFPQVKVIVLTGFEDFTYAQRAVQLQTYDYILKPINYEQLLETVKKAASEVMQHRKLEKKIIESLPLLRIQFFKQLLVNRYERNEIIAKMDLLDLTIPKEHYSVLVIHIDEYDNEFRFKKIKEKELFKFCVINIAQEMAGPQSIVFDNGGEQIVLILEYCSHTSNVEQIAENLRSNVKKYLHNTVSIGIGNVQDDWQHINRSYQEALTALKFRHIYGTDTVLAFARTGVPAGGRKLVTDGGDQKLAFHVRLGERVHALNVIDNVENELIRSKCTDIASIRLTVMQMLFRVYVELEEYHLSVESHAKTEYTHIFNTIEGMQTIQDIFNELRRQVVGLIEAFRKEKTSSPRIFVQKSVDMIQQHYSEEDLNLQYVAKQLHINPVYLSSIFKRTTGINFSVYLQELRMKKAMQLIRSTDLKTYEVAVRVGYSNPNYFSASFKKFTGSSPSDFKEL